jgi:CDP-diacylglycerol---serine O-phosphatidyltransferase
MRVKIGVLPSLVTLGNLICGFAAIGMAAKAQLFFRAEANPDRAYEYFAYAGVLILAAMVFDALDGRIARMTNLVSEFGAQLDSLCDMVSFGIAPAYIVFLTTSSYQLFGHPRYAWVCPLFYSICVALRLARFNCETAPDEESHQIFRGLPSPAAAGVIASLAIFTYAAEFKGAASWANTVMPFVSVVLGGLMVSRVRYLHLGVLLFQERKPFTYLVLVVSFLLTVVALGAHYHYILLAVFSGYAVSGIVFHFWLRARYPAKASSPESEDEDDDSLF